MSELKSFNCVDSDVQEFCEPRLVYLKDETDRRIASLKRIICWLMTKHYKIEVIRTTNYLKACGGHDGYVKARLDKEKQCVKKWLELADKFKEAK